MNSGDMLLNSLELSYVSPEFSEFHRIFIWVGAVIGGGYEGE
jgi:hypothetical protein